MLAILFFFNLYLLILEGGVEREEEGEEAERSIHLFHLRIHSLGDFLYVP